MRLDNQNEIRLEGTFKARFNGFEAIVVKAGEPALVKVHFNLNEGQNKVKMELGSNIKLDRLNSLLKALGKNEVKSINEIDVPEHKGIIPADWDKPLLVECGYPMKRNKVGTEYITTQSNFAEVFMVIGLDSEASTPGTPNGIPQL